MSQQKRTIRARPLGQAVRRNLEAMKPGERFRVQDLAIAMRQERMAVMYHLEKFTDLVRRDDEPGVWVRVNGGKA